MSVEYHIFSFFLLHGTSTRKHDSLSPQGLTYETTTLPQPTTRCWEILIADEGKIMYRCPRIISFPGFCWTGNYRCVSGCNVTWSSTGLVTCTLLKKVRLLVSFEQRVNVSPFRVCCSPPRSKRITMAPRVSVPLTSRKNSRILGKKVADARNILILRKWR